MKLTAIVLAVMLGVSSVAADDTISTSTDFGEYTMEEINKVMKASARAFKACYQRELERTPGLQGKVVVKFKIETDGAVKTARIESTTLNKPTVESCLRAEVLKLRFRQTGKVAHITYPFMFSVGT